MSPLPRVLMALSFGDKFAYIIIIIIIIIIVLLLLFADTAAISQLPANDKERIYERKHCHVTAMSISTAEHYQSAKSCCYFSDILCEIRISKM